MAQAEVNFRIMQKYYYDLHRSYSREIVHLRLKGSRLLRKIKFFEIKMNKRRQQKLEPTSDSIEFMSAMIRKLVKISAFIETYRYFQLIKQPLVNHQNLFHQTANNYYDAMLKNIILKINRLNLSYQLIQDIKDNIEVDFNVVQ